MGEEPEAAEISARSENWSKIANSDAYRRLVRDRSRLTWVLTAVMLAVYFGYILLVAFAREFLGRPLSGGTTTIGIPIGIGVIVTGILLTGIYVHRANRRFDPLEETVRKEAGG